MSEEIKKDEVKSEVVSNSQPVASGENAPKIRQIVIETDGNSVNLVKAEVSGSIELVAVLQALITFITKK